MSCFLTYHTATLTTFWKDNKKKRKYIIFNLIKGPGADFLICPECHKILFYILIDILIVILFH